MNDFTKEELQTILEDITWWSEGDESNFSTQLINKIQNMIDNFTCEHKSDGMIYNSLPPNNRCVICGEFYR